MEAYYEGVNSLSDKEFQPRTTCKTGLHRDNTQRLLMQIIAEGHIWTEILVNTFGRCAQKYWVND